MTKTARHKLPYWAVFSVFFLIFVTLLIVSIISEHKMKLATHPLKYTEYVEHYAEENSLDKYLVYSVIKTESGFQSTAVSNVGAKGLMQMMEPAFDWTKWRMGDDSDTSYEDIFDPETNIKYGTYMLHLLVEELGGVNEALAAYHAGLSKVQGWLADPQYSDDGKTLKTIPTPDTNHYVSKVNKAYETYIDLYN